MPKLYYQGHGSYRITDNDGRVIYVDPYAGDGYDLPADIILVTHQHQDHNQIDRCAQKEDCVIFTNKEAIEAGGYMTCHIDDADISIEAVEAYNDKHSVDECVGFIITLDGVKIYASGDTSKTEQMATFAQRKLDYAILCGDGRYNMGPAEAADCARLIGAKHNMLVHVMPGENIREIAENWEAPNKLILGPGDEIDL
ncbi:MAG: MBL fold metallo-hydrolase [Oscillospiraceae bacterium]|nr:MBL fold metallo-hydrolase [Oscillospiraceae bacterium]